VAYRIVKLAWRSMPTLLRELKRQLDREGESELRRFAVKNAILAVQKARAPPGSFLSAGRSRLNPSAFVRMRPAVHFAFFSLTLTAVGEERSICRLCCRVPHACARLNEPRSADVRMRARGPSAARRAKAAARAEVGTPSIVALVRAALPAATPRTPTLKYTEGVCGACGSAPLRPADLS
jgi:hypothetical protein